MLNDLISRSELWKKFDEAHLFDDGSPRHIAQQIVEEAPAVDAVEVVHGRWEAIEGIDALYKCSACDEWQFVPEELFAYCPYCGAKMDK